MSNPKKKHCCTQMTSQVNYVCTEHENEFLCPDYLISYSPKFDEYGLIIHDRGSSSIKINYCPFCGTELPLSKVDAWFEELEVLGFPEPFEQNIPKKYLTDEWYL